MTGYKIQRRAIFRRKIVLATLSIRVLPTLLLVATLIHGSQAIHAASTEQADIEIGNKLADMLRASRSVVSASQQLINDPEVGDKQFTGEELVSKAQILYEERAGTPLLVDNLSERDRRLIDAQMQAMRLVVDGHQADQEIDTGGTNEHPDNQGECPLMKMPTDGEDRGQNESKEE